MLQLAVLYLLLVLTLSNSDNSKVCSEQHPVDPNVPVISFKRNYTFTEGDSTAVIELTIDREIFQNISVTLVGESFSQPGVVNNGPSINLTQTFFARGSLSISQRLPISDDFVGRENDEQYNIYLIYSSHPADITTSGTTTITIKDNDATSISFARSSYSFMENADLTHQVTIKLNRMVAQGFNATVSGSTTPLATNITDSGSNVSELITFAELDNSQSNLQQIVEVKICNDSVNGEPIQNYTLTLTVHSPNVTVFPIDSTTINIYDDDVSGVQIAPFEGPLFESSKTYNLTVISNNKPPAERISVRVLDQDGNNVSKPIVFQRSAKRSLRSKPVISKTVPFNITDDNIALENDTFIRYSLGYPDNTNLVEPSTVDVVIADDDIVNVTFVLSSYTYNESHGDVSDIQVQLSHSIANSLTVSIVSDSQKYPYSSIVTFPANYSAYSPIPISNFSIINDGIGLKEDEVHQLKFLGASISRNVIFGEPNATTITIVDDDVVTVFFGKDQYEFSEGDECPMVPIVVNRAVARDFTIRVFGVRTSLNSGVENLGHNVNETVTFGPQRALTQYVTLNIIDDDVSVELNETYDLTLIEAPPDVMISANKTTVIIMDNDTTELVLDVYCNYIKEGESTEVCLYLTRVSASNVSVILSISGTSPTASSNDISHYGMQTIHIPAYSTNEQCINIIASWDSEFEDDENFIIAIKNVSLPDYPSSQPSKLLVFHMQFTETITIVDVPPAHRTCYYNSTSQVISTFNDSVTYTYGQICEHALLSQLTEVGKVGVFIDSLTGTFMTTRIGVSIGFNESIVASAYNRTVIRQSPALNLISYTSTATKLTISVLSLGLKVEVTASGVSVIVLTDSRLQNHEGLCGNANGHFTTKNGTIIDTTIVNDLNETIRHFLTPPSETFIRMITRRECGLLGEDLETGDPMFVVPFYTPSAAKAHSYSLCYEIHGYEDETYNFISDECTQVTAHYHESLNPDADLATGTNRSFHSVDQINITAVNNREQCVSISVTLENNICLTSVNGSPLVGKYIHHGISVQQMANRTRVSVPNCADNKLVMYMKCKNLNRIPFIELRVVRGLNLRESSHGLIGQFWNVEVSLTKYTKPLRDGFVADNTYLVELMPRNKPKRSFIGFLYERTWNFEKFPCIYAGDSQGGPIHEVADGEPNDSLIEGTIEDYSAANFVYDQFNSNACMN